jgi:SAM-dependent methyltransferase
MESLDIPTLKQAVQEFWNRQSCGEVYAIGDSLRQQLALQEQTRYQLEPYIFEFARFEEAQGRDVLEIGIGMGADHLQWAKAGPRRLAGIDLTARAVEFTRERLRMAGFTSEVSVGDAEALAFPDASFDIVYSWGVLHHTPNTAKAIQEVYRVLRRGGVARIMVYHTPSLTGAMLWLRYALLKGKPFTEMKSICSDFLESPGTKAFSVAEAESLCKDFQRVNIRVQLGVGDLLQGAAGQRHGGVPLRVARALWPRWLIRKSLSHLGLAMMIEAWK